MQQKHFFLSPPGWENPLGDELSRVFFQEEHQVVSDRWRSIEADQAASEPPALAFALQTMPHALTLSSVSIRKDADAVAIRLREEFATSTSRWRLHVFAPFEAEIVSSGKAKLFRAALLEALKRKAKGLLRALNDASDKAEPGETQVQVSWLSTGTLAISVCDDACRRSWRRSLSPWPGGVAPVLMDKRPPSRAYRKLFEALLQMDRSINPNQSVVDLGGSPGGWSFVALDRRAEVIAVDRSPLRDDLTSHPRLRFVEGDAFKFRPEAQVDWMLADVAAYPERTFELVRQWLSSDWCRSLIATVKFTGASGYAVLEEFKAMLSVEAADFRIRKLLENKNEATIMAWKDTTSSIAGDNQRTAV